MASLQTRPSSGGRTPSMSSLLHQSTRASLRDYATGLLASSSAKPDPVELDPFEPDSTTQDPLLLNPSPHAARPTASSSSPSRLYEPVSGSDAEDGDLDEPASRAAARPDHVDDMLETVGFGTYQRRLLVLAGMGWLADNMWLQVNCLFPLYLSNQNRGARRPHTDSLFVLHHCFTGYSRCAS